MNPGIRAKLDRVHELYPPERLAASKARRRWLWHGGERPDRQPFYYATYKPRYYGTIYPTVEQLLHARLDEYAVRGRVQDDYIPALFTGCKTSTIPSMFGAEEIPVDWTYDCEQVLSSIQEIENLPEPTLEATVAERWLEVLRSLREQTDGELPIHVVDMQGPADVCGKLLGYDQFLVAAYTAPDLFHELMHKATDAFAMLWEAQRDLLGSLFVPTHLGALSWVPNDRRASVSVDSLDMIGPAFYEEFFRPHMENLGERLGALSVHSCGDPRPVLPNVTGTRHVAGINLAQRSLEEIVDTGAGDRVVIIGGRTSVDTVERDMALIREHDLRVDWRITGFWPVDKAHGVSPVDPGDRNLWDTHERIVETLAF